MKAEFQSEPAPIPLIIDEGDFDVVARSSIEAAQRGTRVLGGPDAEHREATASERVIFDALPSVISRRVQKVIPKGFRIAELEFCFKLEGKIWGSGVGGEVKVKLSPSPEQKA